MVIYDRSRHTCRIYEIKHSTEVAERQLRYLNRGEDRTIGDIQYLNVEKYLCDIHTIINLASSNEHYNEA